MTLVQVHSKGQLVHELEQLVQQSIISDVNCAQPLDSIGIQLQSSYHEEWLVNLRSFYSYSRNQICSRDQAWPRTDIKIYIRLTIVFIENSSDSTSLPWRAYPFIRSDHRAGIPVAVPKYKQCVPQSIKQKDGTIYFAICICFDQYMYFFF